MRCILVVLGNLGDKAYPCLKGQTPLQAARTPNLDWLAQMGMNGLFHPTIRGAILPEDIGHFLMFGYETNEVPGRGIIEAIGYGIQVRDGDVALTTRLVSVRQEGDILIMQNARPDIDDESALALQKSVKPFRKDNSELELIPQTGVDGVLVLRGGLSVNITDSDPHRAERPLWKVAPRQGFDKDKDAVRTASLLNIFLRLRYFDLATHPINRKRKEEGLQPVNAVVTSHAGTLMPITPFSVRWGMKGLSMASGTVYRGICRLLGMEHHSVPTPDDPTEGLLMQLKAAREMNDFDFIHIQTDLMSKAAYPMNSEDKKTVIESLDEAFSYARREIVPNDDILLVIVGGHSAPIRDELMYSGESAPLTMIGKYTLRDSVGRFTEIDCAKGALGLVRGKELIYLILNFLGRGIPYRGDPTSDMPLKV